MKITEKEKKLKSENVLPMQNQIDQVEKTLSDAPLPHPEAA